MLRPGHVVVLCVVALLSIGVLMVNSAGMSLDPKQAVDIPGILLSRSTFYMFLALGAMAAVSVLPLRRLAAPVLDAPLRPAAELIGSPLGPRALWLGAFGLIACLLLVYVPHLRREVNGSTRWIGVPVPGLGDLSMQPSEIAKWGMILLISWYGATRGHILNRFWAGLVPALAAVAVVAVAVVKEDLGTGFLLACVACILLLAAGARPWHFIPMGLVGGLGIAGAIAAEPYRMRRITSFMDPYADPEGTGYHMIQSMVAIANGRVWGRGLGFGLQKFGYLPEDRTDFLFAVICEELGVMGAATVVFLYLGILWAGLTIIRREPHVFLKLLGLGILATVGLQATINLAVVTGLGPTKGIALPMLSSGGTGWILTAASLGVLVAIDRSQRQGAPRSGGRRSAPAGAVEGPLGTPDLVTASFIAPGPSPVVVRQGTRDFLDPKPQPPAVQPPAHDAQPGVLFTPA